ncbi:hypothetical protein Pcinc_006390 [Petrolisthes cinctipes]|uniref:DDE-1 domain-containing protein n=1 Tax=Petrolisthes cinctipes TaxID=88211 RepID=A0AAE1GD14_PETCI|nr:hypothetical protein Pcinc_006390 [Petrolisthes cinctipes]
MPKNTQVRKGEEKTPGKKMSKERLSSLHCANASGTHRLKLVVVGKSKKPRALKDIMNNLPVIYYNSINAWFMAAIFTDWFFSHFITAVRKYQEEVLKIKPEDVKAILILDNAPAHPTADGKIRVMYLPPNTTSMIQPMDQGIISACKRRYTKRYLDEVLVVLETEEDIQEDTRAARTKDNIKNYTIRSALYNLANSWQDMKATTLENCWKKLLIDVEEDSFEGFEGFEAKDFKKLLHKAGEKNVTEDDVRDWTEENESDPGYQVLSMDEIAAEVTEGDKEESSDDDDEELQCKKVKLSTLRSYMDVLIDYTTYSKIKETEAYYNNLRMLRELVIREQHMGGTQTKMDSFFASQAAAIRPQPDEFNPDDPQPSTSGTKATTTTTMDSDSDSE